MIIVNLKHLMVQKGASEGRRLSYADIRKATGIGHSTLSRIANDPGYNVSREHIEKLCKYFGCPIEEFMTIVPDPPESAPQSDARE